jgi:hypothetical protein
MWIDWHCEEAVYVYNNLVATLKWLAGGGLEEWRGGGVEEWSRGSLAWRPRNRSEHHANAPSLP